MLYKMGCHEKQLRLIKKGEINIGILSVYKIDSILETYLK